MREKKEDLARQSICLRSLFSAKDYPKSTNSEKKTGSRLCNKASSALRRPKKMEKALLVLTRLRLQSSSKPMMDKAGTLASASAEEVTKLQRSRSKKL
jgi:hypothetical protein